MPRVRRGLMPAVVCALALGGCGSSSDSTPRMTQAQSQALVAQLERARVTATAGDLAGTQTALVSFRALVARLRRSGALDSATANALRIGAIRALARAKSDSTPAPVQTQTTPVPALTKEQQHKLEEQRKQAQKKQQEQQKHDAKKGHG
jgi:hypothetical protein